MRLLVIGFAMACLALAFGTASRACEGYAVADVIAAIDDGQAAFAQATATDVAKKPAKKKVAMQRRNRRKRSDTCASRSKRSD